MPPLRKGRCQLADGGVAGVVGVKLSYKKGKPDFVHSFPHSAKIYANALSISDSLLRVVTLSTTPFFITAIAGILSASASFSVILAFL